MIQGLRALGVAITATPDAATGTTLHVVPGPMTGAAVDCGLAGTVMRFLPPAAALAEAPSPSTATSRPAPGRWARFSTRCAGSAPTSTVTRCRSPCTVTVACAAGR